MSELATAPPCTIVIFGASGDLTRRKLIPALYHLRVNGMLPRAVAVIGVARGKDDDAGFRAKMTAALEAADPKLDRASAADLIGRMSYVGGELHDPATYRALAARMGGGNALFYLAVPPEVFGPVVGQLGAAGLTREGDGWRRVVIEKPFGRDLESARALDRQLHAVLREPQIFRIDHYLGKETVQNLLVLRFANGIFEPVWNRQYVDDVQITVAEVLGVEGRGGYYDSAGVLRDMIQNHMLQLLALVAMEPPGSLAAEAVRNERVKVLEAIRPMDDAALALNTVRGQYGAGTIGGASVPAYRDEPNVPAGSRTETYAALKLEIDSWRWAGVPFYLRSGKRLAKRDTEIVINFKRPPLHLFEQVGVEAVSSNRLIIHVQPDEGIQIRFKAKVPGPAFELRTVALDFGYEQFGPRSPSTGYERLLHDVMLGDATLFHREDMVDAAWRIATPIVERWAALPAPGFPDYAAGSWGPAAADALLARDGHHWVQPE